MRTVVIFRVFKDGDVLALFPYEPGTGEPDSCSSYQRVGQHSSADYTHCIKATRPATPEEYAPLKAELESIGYELAVKLKRSHK